jgi:hypothetical protein
MSMSAVLKRISKLSGLCPRSTGLLENRFVPYGVLCCRRLTVHVLLVHNQTRWACFPSPELLVSAFCKNMMRFCLSSFHWIWLDCPFSSCLRRRKGRGRGRGRRRAGERPVRQQVKGRTEDISKVIENFDKEIKPLKAVDETVVNKKRPERDKGSVLEF